MKKYLAGMALLISLNSFAAVTISGNYVCKGHEVGTKEAFTCQMTIKKTGETYSSSATCSDGNAYRGTGIYDKSTQQLSTSFINPKKLEETGISIATIKSHGRLTAAWTYLDKTSIAYSTCHKNQAPSKKG